jgi:hypothetical protein
VKSNLYYCPVCHTIGPRTIARHNGGTTYCCNCENYLEAGAAGLLPVLSSKAIDRRKMENPAFPHIDPELMKEIIIQGNLKGEDIDNDIIPKMDKMFMLLDNRLKDEIRKYSLHAVEIISLRCLDEIYRQMMNYEQQTTSVKGFSKNAAIEDLLKKSRMTLFLGQSLERIVEICLSEKEISSKLFSISDFQRIFEISYELVVENYSFENFLCLWDRKGKLSISENSWKLECGSGILTRMEAIITGIGQEQYRLRRETINFTSEGVNNLEEYIEALLQLTKRSDMTMHTKLGNDTDEFIRSIDQEHSNQFGHSFSERLLAQAHLCLVSPELDYDLEFEDEVINFLCHKMGISINKANSILQLLYLKGESINLEHVRPFSFRRLSRLLRRPIPLITVGQRNVCFLSSPIIGRCLVNLTNEYMGCSHPELENSSIKRITDKLNADYAEYFVRERIAAIFKKQNFNYKFHIKKMGKTNLEVPEIGEIDILAIKDGTNKIIIGECKFSSLPNINVRGMSLDINDYLKKTKGNVDTFLRKIRWINQHQQEVLRYFGMENEPRTMESVPMFITNIFTPSSQIITDIPFVQEYELEEWLSRL